MKHEKDKQNQPPVEPLSTASNTRPESFHKVNDPKAQRVNPWRFRALSITLPQYVHKFVTDYAKETGNSVSHVISAALACNFNLPSPQGGRKRNVVSKRTLRTKVITESGLSHRTRYQENQNEAAFIAKLLATRKSCKSRASRKSVASRVKLPENYAKRPLKERLRLLHESASETASNSKHTHEPHASVPGASKQDSRGNLT